MWGRHSHSRKWELESSRTPKNLEDDCRGQNTSHWGVLYTVGKVLKCRCPKWPCMSHLDIYNPSYEQKKGRESNWQFDSRPLKVRNRPTSDVSRWSATQRWKALKVVASPESGLWWVKWVQVPVACPNIQGCSRMWTNLLLVGFGCRFVWDYNCPSS
jgi:hypothetical protein